MPFADLIKVLEELFGDDLTLFHRRWKILTKKVPGDYDVVLDETNLDIDRSEFDKLTVEGFKYSVSAMRLQDPNQLPYRSVILKEMEKPDVDFEKIRIACRLYSDRSANLKVGAASSSSAEVKAIQNRSGQKSPKKSNGSISSKQTSSFKVEDSSRICQGCGSSAHRRKDCPFKTATCFKCQKEGHLGKICRSTKGAAKVNVIVISDIATGSQASSRRYFDVGLN